MTLSTQRRRIKGLLLVLLLGLLNLESASGQVSSFAYADLDTISITVQTITDRQGGELQALLSRDTVFEVAHRIISEALSTARPIKIVKYDGSSEMVRPSNLIVAIQLSLRTPAEILGVSDLVNSSEIPGLGSISMRTYRSAWPLNVQPGFFELRSDVIVLSRDPFVLKGRLEATLERQLQPLCASILARNSERR